MTDAVKQEGRLKGTVLAVLVAGALLASASDSSLAAGSKATVGGDKFRTSRPALAGQLSGTSGIDRLGSFPSVERESGKVGGGMDRRDQSILSLGSL